MATLLNLAIIGAGGRGGDNLEALAATGAVNIVAICDCDARQAGDAFKQYPNAARFADWRRLLDSDTAFDAVVVSTPDHNHAMISTAAMRRGKHVYCEKPLAHSIFEAREMARVAAEHRVVTQMGTQGHAFEGTRRAVEVLRAGVIGEVTELHVWTDRPAGWWPQGIVRPADTPAVPEGLDWDVWLGPAPAASVQPRLCAIQMARLLGLRHRRHRRHGHPQPRHGVLGPRARRADVGGREGLFARSDRPRRRGRRRRSGASSSCGLPRATADLR